jgi:spore coat protein H
VLFKASRVLVSRGLCQMSERNLHRGGLVAPDARGRGMMTLGPFRGGDEVRVERLEQAKRGAGTDGMGYNRTAMERAENVRGKLRQVPAEAVSALCLAAASAGAILALFISGCGVAGGAVKAGDEVFDPGVVHRLRLELPRESREKLRQEGEERMWVRATLHEGERRYPDIGMRLKGSEGSFRPLDDKPAITIKFDFYVPGQRFHGYKKIILNNAVQDPSYLSDMLGSELFRAAGIPAQRFGHARLYLDGRDLGFYVLAEAPTRDFLARWFPDPSGNLYEGPGDVDSDELDGDAHGGKVDGSDLKALAEAAGERDPRVRMEKMGRLLDLDRFFAFVALETITWHWDGYCMASNNYYIYSDPAGKFVFFPHGMDQLFGEPGAPAFPKMNALVSKALLRTAEGKRRYLEKLTVLSASMDVEALRQKISTSAARIRAAIAESGEDAAAAHDEAVASLIGRLTERMKSLPELIVKGEPAPRKPIELDATGTARPSGWEPVVQMGDPELKKTSAGGSSGGPTLQVSIPHEGEWCASWRATVFLPAGRYRFTGLARTKGVRALGVEGEEPPSGACLRISGRQPETKLLGDSDWRPIEFEFEVEDDGSGEEGVPAGAVVIVCELRAARGAAWFDERSLLLSRIAAEKKEL